MAVMNVNTYMRCINFATMAVALIMSHQRKLWRLNEAFERQLSKICFFI